MTVLEAASAIRQGRLTSTDLTLDCLQRIQDWNQRLNAFQTVTADRAIEDAFPGAELAVPLPEREASFGMIFPDHPQRVFEAMELSDIENLGPLQQLEAELAELLAEEDVANLANAMDPGSTAGVLIWENLWAAPFASAARRSGGQLIADGRIPIQAIIASIEADDDAIEGD